MFKGTVSDAHRSHTLSAARRAASPATASSSVGATRSALCIGMAFITAKTSEAARPTRGTVVSTQRDRERLLVLEEQGITVFTASKGAPVDACEPGKHCQAFYSTRGASDIAASRTNKNIGNVEPFHIVCLDYWRFPDGYLQKSLVLFLQHTLPNLIGRGVICTGAQIYFLNHQLLRDAAVKAIQGCKLLPMIEEIEANDYPLYRATDGAVQRMKCRGVDDDRKNYELTDNHHAGQLRGAQNAELPFVRLTIKSLSAPARARLDERLSSDARKKALERQAARLKRQTAAIANAIDQLGYQVLKPGEKLPPNTKEGTYVFDSYTEESNLEWSHACTLDLSEGLAQLGCGGLGVIAKSQLESGSDLGPFLGWHCTWDQLEAISELVDFNTTFQISQKYVVIGRPDSYGTIVNAPNGLRVPAAGREKQWCNAEANVGFSLPPRKDGAPGPGAKLKDVMVTRRRGRRHSVLANQEIFVSYGNHFFNRMRLCCEICYKHRPDVSMVTCHNCQLNHAHEDCSTRGTPSSTGPAAAASAAAAPTHAWLCDWCDSTSSAPGSSDLQPRHDPGSAPDGRGSPRRDASPSGRRRGRNSGRSTASSKDASNQEPPSDRDFSGQGSGASALNDASLPPPPDHAPRARSAPLSASIETELDETDSDDPTAEHPRRCVSDPVPLSKARSALERKKAGRAAEIANIRILKSVGQSTMKLSSNKILVAQMQAAVDDVIKAVPADSVREQTGEILKAESTAAARDAVLSELREALSVDKCFEDFQVFKELYKHEGEPCWMNVPHVVKKGGETKHSRECSVMYLHQKRVQLYLDHYIKPQARAPHHAWSTAGVKGQIDAMLVRAFQKLKLREAAGAQAGTTERTADGRVYPFFDVEGSGLCRRCFAVTVGRSLRDIERKWKKMKDAPLGSAAPLTKKPRIVMSKRRIAAANAVLKNVAMDGQCEPTGQSGQVYHVPHSTMKQWNADINRGVANPISARTLGRGVRLLEEANWGATAKLTQSKGIAQCGTCHKLDEQIHDEKATREDRRVARKLKEAHLKQARVQRNDYYRRCVESQLHPNRSWTLHVDGMDQDKTELPSYRIESKSHDSLAKLMTHVNGVFAFGAPMSAAAYVDFKTVAKDSDLTLTTIIHFLRMNAEILQARRRGEPVTIPRNFGGISTSHEPPTVAVSAVLDDVIEEFQQRARDAADDAKRMEALLASVNPSVASGPSPERVVVEDGCLRRLTLRRYTGDEEVVSALPFGQQELLRHIEATIKSKHDAACAAGRINNDVELVPPDSEEAEQPQVPVDGASPLSRAINPDASADSSAGLPECTEWPEELNLQFDNASGDGKNNTVFAFAAYLVKIGLFKRVNVNFMIVGHTHDKCDQYFSRVSTYLETHSAKTPSAFAKALADAHEKPCKPMVFWVHQTVAFKDYLLDKSIWKNLQGTTSAYCFNFQNAADRRAAAERKKRADLAQAWARRLLVGDSETVEARQVEDTFKLARLLRQQVDEHCQQRGGSAGNPAFVAVADGGYAGLGVFAARELKNGEVLMPYGGLLVVAGQQLRCDSEYAMKISSPGHLLDAELFAELWHRAAMVQLGVDDADVQRAFAAQGSSPIGERAKIVMDNEKADAAMESLAKGLSRAPCAEKLRWLLVHGGYGFLLNTSEQPSRSNCAHSDHNKLLHHSVGLGLLLKTVKARQDVKAGTPLVANYNNKMQRELRGAAERGDRIDVMFGATAMANEQLADSLWRMVMPRLPQYEPMPNPLSRLDPADQRSSGDRKGLLETIVTLLEENSVNSDDATEWLTFLYKQARFTAGACAECVQLRSTIAGITIPGGKRKPSPEDEARRKRLKAQKADFDAKLRVHRMNARHAAMVDYMLAPWPEAAAARCCHQLNDRAVTCLPDEKDSLAKRNHFHRSLEGHAGPHLERDEEKEETPTDRQHLQREGERRRVLVQPLPRGQTLVSSVKRRNGHGEDIIINVPAWRDVDGKPERPDDRHVYFAVLVNDYRLKVLQSTTPFLIAKLAWAPFVDQYSPNQQGTAIDVNLSELPEGRWLDVRMYQPIAPTDEKEKKQWQTWSPGAEAAELTRHAQHYYSDDRLVISRADLIVHDMARFRWAPETRVERLEPYAIICKFHQSKSSLSPFTAHGHIRAPFLNDIYAHLTSAVSSQVRDPTTWSSLNAQPGASGEHESAEVLEQISITPNDKPRWTTIAIDDLRALSKKQRKRPAAAAASDRPASSASTTTAAADESDGADGTATAAASQRAASSQAADDGVNAAWARTSIGKRRRQGPQDQVRVSKKQRERPAAAAARLSDRPTSSASTTAAAADESDGADGTATAAASQRAASSQATNDGAEARTSSGKRRRREWSDSACEEIIIQLRDKAGRPLEDQQVFFAVLVNDFRYKVMCSTSPLLIAKLAWPETLHEHPRADTLTISQHADVPVHVYHRATPSTAASKNAWETWNPGADANQLTALARSAQGDNDLLVSRYDVIVATMEDWRLYKSSAVTRAPCCAILCQLPTKPFKKDRRMISKSADLVYKALTSIVPPLVQRPQVWAGTHPAIRVALAGAAAASSSDSAAVGQIELESDEVLQVVCGSHRWTAANLAALQNAPSQRSNAGAPRHAQPQPRPQTSATSRDLASESDSEAESAEECDDHHARHNRKSIAALAAAAAARPTPQPSSRTHLRRQSAENAKRDAARRQFLDARAVEVARELGEDIDEPSGDDDAENTDENFDASAAPARCASDDEADASGEEHEASDHDEPRDKSDREPADSDEDDAVHPSPRRPSSRPPCPTQQLAPSTRLSQFVTYWAHASGHMYTQSAYDQNYSESD